MPRLFEIKFTKRMLLSNTLAILLVGHQPNQIFLRRESSSQSSIYFVSPSRVLCLRSALEARIVENKINLDCRFQCGCRSEKCCTIYVLAIRGICKILRKAAQAREWLSSPTHLSVQPRFVTPMQYCSLYLHGTPEYRSNGAGNLVSEPNYPSSHDPQ